MLFIVRLLNMNCEKKFQIDWLTVCVVSHLMDVLECISPLGMSLVPTSDMTL